MSIVRRLAGHAWGTAALLLLARPEARLAVLVACFCLLMLDAAGVAAREGFKRGVSS